MMLSRQRLACCVVMTASVWAVGEAVGEKPSFTPLVCPTLEEMEQGLRAWQERRPEAMKVEVAGKTPNGRDVLLVRVTDFEVPDDDKQITLFVTCHAATEKNGVTSLLFLVKWLVSDDPAAERIRRRQIVLVMPCNDPEGYARGGRVREVYMCWDWDGVTDPEKHPEAAVLQQVIDRHRPEAYVDVHGFNWAEQMMWESTGITWGSGGYNRSFVPEVPLRMNAAAEEAGFLITMGEQSEGKLLATGPVPGADEHFYARRGRVNPSCYQYHQYHTLAMTMEVGFEQSAVARLRKLLEIGTGMWRGERYPGYPVNQVGCWTSMAVAAWGATASERRASRVELWQKAGQLAYGCAHPEPRKTMMAFFSPDPEARQRIAGDKKLDAVVERLRDEPGYDVEAIADFIETTPAINAALTGPMKAEAEEPTINSGVVLRLLIPYPDAQLTHLRLDGNGLAESDTDGYRVHHNPGTIVEVAIPPGKVKPFHVVTCAYSSAADRRPGFRAEDWE